MRNINYIDFNSFTYNGHSSEEFEIEIGGINGMQNISVLPSVDRKTSKITNLHGEVFTSQTINPRIIEIPIILHNVELLRDISMWLYTEEPQWLQLGGDSLKIKAMIDTNAVDLSDRGYIGNILGGLLTLKFICLNPFWYNEYEQFKPYIENLSNFKIFNDCNFKSFPILKITGIGNCTITINETSFTLTGLVDTNPITVDTQYMSCFDSNNINKISTFSGDFPMFKPYENVITTVGNLSKVEIKNNSRWL